MDFGADANFNGFMTATASLSGTVQAMINDIAGSCKAIAVDLGADENAVIDTDPAVAVKAWCDLAVTQMTATFGADLKASIKIVAQAPVCTVNASAQANCEASCDVNISADCEAQLGDVKARCEPGELAVKCEGGCSGSCQGSANLAVKCEGKCEGTCEGSCEGSCEGDTDQGAGCKGDCTGKCGGECRGTCQVEANANVECSGECKGECSGTASAPKCQGQVTPPSGECSASAEGDCSANCSASAQASAECKPPSLEIIYTGSGQVSAQALGTLKLNLPKIFLVGQRAADLQANIGAIFNFGTHLDPGSFSGEAILCLPKAVAAITATFNDMKGRRRGVGPDRRLLQRPVASQPPRPSPAGRRAAPICYNPRVLPNDHRLAELRSLALHQAVCLRLASEPSIRSRALARVQLWIASGEVASEYAHAWKSLLEGPTEALGELLCSDSESARALRQVTPFSFVIPPRERWRIWKQVREQRERGQ